MDCTLLSVLLKNPLNDPIVMTIGSFALASR